MVRVENSIPCMILCSGLVLMLQSITSADIVKNGDFEIAVPTNGTGGNWTSSSVGFGGWSATGGNPDGHMLLNAGGGTIFDPTVQQTLVGLTIGREYTVTWDYALHVSIAPNGNSFGVFLDTQTDPSALDNSKLIFIGEHLSNLYTTESTTFTATSTSHELFFSAELDNRTNGGLSNSDVSYRLDNVSVVASIPEPASGMAAGIFLFLVCARRRRTQSKTTAR